MQAGLQFVLIFFNIFNFLIVLIFFNIFNTLSFNRLYVVKRFRIFYNFSALER